MLHVPFLWSRVVDHQSLSYAMQKKKGGRVRVQTLVQRAFGAGPPGRERGLEFEVWVVLFL
jgi:hypothetical protein